MRGWSGVSWDGSLPTRQLLDLDIESLLDLSGRAAEKALAINPLTVTAAPIIITGACTTSPGCRHCKWEHLKAMGRPPFIDDRSVGALTDWAHALADAGMHRAFFGTGWLGYRLPRQVLEKVEDVCAAEPRLEYYGLFGALDRQSHFDLASAGLTGMLTSLESPSERVYRSFRPGGDSLADRLKALGHTKEAGLKAWTGFLVGLGEDADEVAWGLDALRQIGPESVSILPFEPFEETAMRDHPPTDELWLARVNAAARVVLEPSTVLFSDHYRDVDERFGAAVGFNGSYITTPPSKAFGSQAEGPGHGDRPGS